MPRYILLSKTDYFKDLIIQVKNLKKNDHLSLMTMTIDHHSTLVATLFYEIQKSLRRGAKILILIDSYEYLISNKQRGIGPLFYSKKLDGPLSSRYYQLFNNWINELTDDGARVEIINKPSRILSSFVRGRSHIKLAVLDHVTYLGGVNLTDDGHEDYMVKINDLNLSNDLFEIIEEIAQVGHVKQALKSNLILNLTQDSIIIDRGQMNSSIILSQAIDLIANADREIIFTCQFFPDDSTFSALKSAARRGVKTKIIFNHHSKHYFPLSTIQFMMFMANRILLPKNLKLVRRLKSQNYLHSKILLTDKTLMIGSHNLVGAGVKYATAEVTLKSNDSDLLNQIRSIYG